MKKFLLVFLLAGCSGPSPIAPGPMVNGAQLYPWQYEVRNPGMNPTTITYFDGTSTAVTNISEGTTWVSPAVEMRGNDLGMTIIGNGAASGAYLRGLYFFYNGNQVDYTTPVTVFGSGPTTLGMVHP